MTLTKRVRPVLGASLIVAGSTAYAGGLDRSNQNIDIIFENRNYVQLSYSNIDPSLTSDGIPTLAAPTSDAGPSYTNSSFALNTQVNEQLSFALVLDQPYGASVRYTDGPFDGGFADVNSEAATFLARYQFGNGLSVHGGLRAQQLFGSIASIGLLTASSGTDYGYTVGVAWERPDIAARVALTYNSEIVHTMRGTENFQPTEFDFKTPEAINLSFQTGIAENTLLFGSLRYAAYDGVDVTTPGLGTYIRFDQDPVTLSLGVGRRFNDNWSGAVLFGYEEGDGTATTLNPTSGYKSVGLSLTYEEGPLRIRGGVRYVDLDTATARGVPFAGNDATAFGIQIGYAF